MTSPAVAPSATPYTVEVQASTPAHERFELPTAKAVHRALAAEQVPAGSGVAVLLATDPEIAEAHQRFLGLAGPTDVMSWQSGEPVAAPGAFLGDVMVSCHTALRQAEELGHRWDREVCVLAVHGVLHLLGWDDQTPQDRACMQARVDAIVDAT